MWLLIIIIKSLEEDAWMMSGFHKYTNHKTPLLYIKTGKVMVRDKHHGTCNQFSSFELGPDRISQIIALHWRHISVNFIKLPINWLFVQPIPQINKKETTRIIGPLRGKWWPPDSLHKRPIRQSWRPWFQIGVKWMRLCAVQIHTKKQLIENGFWQIFNLI